MFGFFFILVVLGFEICIDAEIVWVFFILVVLGFEIYYLQWGFRNSGETLDPFSVQFLEVSLTYFYFYFLIFFYFLSEQQIPIFLSVYFHGEFGKDFELHAAMSSENCLPIKNIRFSFWSF